MSKLDKRAISTLVIALFLLSTITAVLPTSYATHTSTATVAFTSGASKVLGLPSSLDVVVLNVGPDPISTVVIDIDVIAGTKFQDIAVGTPPTGWTGVWAADFITYTGGPIASGASVTFVPEVTNPPTAGLTANPVVETSDNGALVAATLTTGSAASMNDITYVAKTLGEAGNSITIEYTETIPDSTILITGDPTTINVELADTGGIISSTALHVVTDVNAHPSASLIVDASTTTGTGLMVATVGGPEFLSGGNEQITNFATQVTGELVILASGDFSIDHVSQDEVQYDDTVTVWGSGVTSGSVVELYWDTAVGDNAYLLNSTEGDPDGTFECDFDVPSDVIGNHYIWVKDVATLTTKSYGPITMDPKLTLSPKSGLSGDDVTIKGYGFAADIEITDITFASVPLTTSPATPDTDELGYWTATFEVPPLLTGVQQVATMSITADFTIGASISFDVDEGPVGTVVEISGRGFFDSNGETIPETFGYVTLGGSPCLVTEGDTIVLGKFDIEVVIPNPLDDEPGEYPIIVKVPRTPGDPPSEIVDADFDVTGLAEIETEYAFGVQGTTIDIEGWNFTRISGEEVRLELWKETITDVYTQEIEEVELFETDSKGYFSGTFQVPAISSDKYLLKATQEDYEIYGDTGFRIGLMLVLIYPTSGPTGTNVVLTGMGFTDGGKWNATFGGVSIVDDGKIDGETNLKGADDKIPTFIVPTLDVGQYTLEVNDISDPDSIITVSLEFMVTDTTTLVTDPLVAPNEYLVEVKGKYFSSAIVDVEFVIYNVTAAGVMDKDWDMTVGDVETDKDGNFTGLWIVPDNEVLSVGDYLINATDDDGLFAQYLFSVVEKTVEIEPRKPSFALGETLYFDIESSFAMDGSYIEIYDPHDELYWKTDLFEAEEWLKVGTIERMPYYQQTAGGNPMTLMDATVGPWFWEMFYEDDPVCNGTFEVTPAPSDILTDRINALSGELAQLADDITGVTDDISGDIADLSSDISDVEANVQDMIDDITADLAEELAGVAADTEAAVDELEDVIGDIAEAQNELASDLEDSLQTSVDAKEAAEAAQRTSQGVTTLVYGAIAASLIAALAAIVSLMQISKKIA